MADVTTSRTLGARFLSLCLMACAFWMFMMVSCEESLPPREDPSVVFRPVIRPVYIHDWNENGLRFYLDVVNAFDETLQDTAIFTGSMLIEMPRMPDMSRTMVVRRESLATRKMYDPVNNIFTVDAGDTLRFLLRWDFKSDAGRWLPGAAFEYYGDTTCSGRRLAYEEVLLLSGRLRISRRLGEIVFSQIPFVFCYKEPFIGPKYCPKAPELCDRRAS